MPSLNRLRKSRYVFYLTLAAVGCLLAVLGHSGVRHTVLAWMTILFDQFFWVQVLTENPVWGVAIFLMAHTVAAVCGIPGTFLVMIGGVVFGLIWGTVLSVVGATLGAIAAFCVARYYFRQWVTQRLNHHVARKTLYQLNHLIQQSELSCVLALRFAPISPFSIVNFLFGLTRISFKTYTVGTFVGIIPGTLAYTWLGVAGHSAWTGNGIMPLIFALVILTVLSAIPLLVQRYR